MPHLKDVIPDLQTVIYVSDGAGSQYKNFKNFSNLCHHKADHGLHAEWHFFATSHGKSPCDGIGGTVKRLAARASLQATKENHILTPSDLYKWASENIKGISFRYVSTEDVAQNCEHYGLSERFEAAKKLVKTRSHHCYIPISENELKMKRVSSDASFTQVSTKEEVQQCATLNQIPFSSLIPGKYIACIYDQQWYIGSIIECSSKDEDVLVDFMKRTRSGLFIMAI